MKTIIVSSGCDSDLLTGLLAIEAYAENIKIIIKSFKEMADGWRKSRKIDNCDCYVLNYVPPANHPFVLFLSSAPIKKVAVSECFQYIYTSKGKEYDDTKMMFDAIYTPCEMCQIWRRKDTHTEEETYTRREIAAKIVKLVLK